MSQGELWEEKRAEKKSKVRLKEIESADA